MTIHDISVCISDTLPVFPGDPPPRLTPRQDDAGWRTTLLSLGSHTGTHLDAPAHLLEQGATLDAIPLERLIGPCRVADLAQFTGPIGAAELRRLKLKGNRRLLLRTRNSEFWGRRDFVPDYAGLTAEAAALLVDWGVNLVGIDYLSIEAAQGEGEVHRRLLEAGVVILEGLNLKGITAGDYELLCLPLKIAAADGAPCRAVLRSLDPPRGYPQHHTGWPP
ncbi:cyclase [Desulfuromonas versatilis]|uniref:Cyclase n=1 Tax=Desulfuromonas versatilis TaxID=2802975 RepID=A0ABM8HY35_9BACT|nr:cyclase family protein [Desulfuromonas versatilis]BCR06884.1 cyclase [Desulfuromonas versatilis]